MYDLRITFQLKDETRIVDKREIEPWKVTLVNTGLETLTATRILKIKEYVGNDSFMLTYRDGVADINIDQEFWNI